MFILVITGALESNEIYSYKNQNLFCQVKIVSSKDIPKRHEVYFKIKNQTIETLLDEKRTEHKFRRVYAELWGKPIGDDQGDGSDRLLGVVLLTRFDGEEEISVHELVTILRKDFQISGIK